MKLKNIPPVKNNILNVIIETPRDSQNKFDYDPEYKIFRLKKTLPMGSTFPFDFGFVPSTQAEDGDPLDVLVIMDQHAYPGCLVECRILGILQAEQIEKDKKKEKNDRIIAVSCCSMLYSDIKDIKELNKNMVSEIENFFEDYNRQEGKKFIPLRWSGRHEAIRIIHKHSVYKKKKVH